jgi:hypothetical protein
LVRLSRILWPFPFLVRLGWLSARCPNPDPARIPGRVFFLRGNGVLFSRGFGTLCAHLRRAGVWAEDLRCVGDLWACRCLRAERRAGRLHGPVVFIGHSCGGRYALYAAEALRKEDIPVDLVICLDVAFPPPVPANVRRAVHLYLGGVRIYPARPLIATHHGTIIENHDLKAPGSPIPARGLHHLNITGSPVVQGFVMERLRGVLPA